MSDPQVKVDELTLDNGSWRRIVGSPAVIADPAGKMREFHVEFVIMGDTAAERDSRWDSTFNDFFLLNARLRVWHDAAKVTPTFDWYVGDNFAYETVSVVTQLPEESQTQAKLHCLLSFMATVMPAPSTSVPNQQIQPSGAEIQGLVGNVQLSKHYLDSERYTLSCAGTFVQTLNESAEGPHDLAGVSDNGGKARFTLESPDEVSADFDTGMFIDVSTPSAYEGRHFITAISDAGGGEMRLIDTQTDFVAIEADVAATVLVGTTTDAEANFQSSRSLLLVNLLETGTGGAPASVSPNMVKLSETITYSSERKDQLDFVLVSGPQALRLGAVDDSGNVVERGLSYSVRYVPPDKQDTSYAPFMWTMVIEGKCSIADPDEDKDLTEWYDLIRSRVQTEVSTITNTRLGGALRITRASFGVDYTTNDITFVMDAIGNYTGTMSYSRQESESESKPRTIWRNTDGTHHVQQPPGPNDKSRSIKIDWVGDAGGGPGMPPTPVEAGYEYLLTNINRSNLGDGEDQDGNRYSAKVIEVTWTRVKPASSGGGGGVGLEGGIEVGGIGYGGSKVPSGGGGVGIHVP